MKRALFAGIAILASAAVPAIAADIPMKAARAAPVAVASAYNWTGIYSASSIGGQWWDIRGAYVNVFPGGDLHNTKGTELIFGSHLGAQVQFGNWVFGVEGGYHSAFNPRFTSSLSVGPDCLGVSAIANRTCESRINNYWTAGGKLGYAFDNIMIYATGGYANGKIDTQTLVTGTNVLTSATSARHSGWYAGAGFDVFITKFLWSDLILGIEYQHVDFSSVRHVDTLPGATGINNRDIKATDDSVRVKATFKFNPGGSPVVARY